MRYIKIGCQLMVILIAATFVTISGVNLSFGGENMDQTNAVKIKICSYGGQILEENMGQANPVNNSADPAGLRKTGASKILFLGNSITLHGPAPAIGWSNACGMAASAMAKDYVHVFIDAITEMTGSKPAALINTIAEFERQYESCDQDAMFKEQLAFKAEIVILAIGENVAALTSDSSKQLFQAKLTKLLTALKNNGNPTILVRSSFWADPTKDDIMRTACKEVGGIFVDISALGKDEANFARSERAFAHAGVAAHPGDKGMKAIADALVNALKVKLGSGQKLKSN